MGDKKVKRHLRRLSASAAVLIALVAGCRTSPSPGIEFGNPNLDGKSIRVVPAGLDETYEISLLDEENAAIDQKTTEDVPALLDSVVVPYTLAGSLLRLEATFANARHIVVSANVPETTGDIDGTLTVDGKVTEACFEIPGFSPSCGGDRQDKEDLEVDETPPPSSSLPRISHYIPVHPPKQDDGPGPGLGDSPPCSGDQDIAASSPPDCKDGKCWIPYDVDDLYVPSPRRQITIDPDLSRHVLSKD